MNRVVLAYSGGARGAAAIRALRARGYEVVAVTLDLGDRTELTAVRERALSLGAARAHVLDCRDEFVSDFVMPSLRAGVFAGSGLALVADLARPLVVRRLVDIGRMEAASALAHTADPAQGRSSQLLELLRARAPETPITGLDSELPAGDASGPAVESNLWGRVVRTSPADSTTTVPFTLTRDVADAPATAAVVEVDFLSGTPVAANGIEMSALELIESLETIAGAHGVGRVTIDDRSMVEAPAAVVLQAAHGALERHVVGEDLSHMTQQLAGIYRRVVAEGRWFSDLREGIDAFVGILQPRMNGSVRLRLSHGECAVMDVRAASQPKAVA